MSVVAVVIRLWKIMESEKGSEYERAKYFMSDEHLYAPLTAIIISKKGVGGISQNHNYQRLATNHNHFLKFCSVKFCASQTLYKKANMILYNLIYKYLHDVSKSGRIMHIVTLCVE